MVEVANEGLFAAQCTAMQGVVLASFLKDSRIGELLDVMSCHVS